MAETAGTGAAIPLYLQIAESLSRDIASGRLPDGIRLPPERDLAVQFRTTVRTLRKGLAELERQGLLSRVQGSGNYVRMTDGAKSIYSMFRLELPEGGGLPTAEVLGTAEIEKPADLPAFGRSDRATRIRRLRRLDGIPAALEEIWLDRGSGAVDPERLQDSLYRFYRMELGFWISRAEDRVSVGRVPHWAPENFGQAPDDCCGFVERLGWAQEAAPVEYSRTWFDPGRTRYVQRMK
ncbi:GntR family transcriptional regulator [Mangrovicoccus sp. HB161399]|uniref:GntR family transcriptional regulator n=1 Tax=Mangrovicoccus sp. HB161399 TaxID=2720392 RepID=UPI00352FA7CF